MEREALGRPHWGERWSANVQRPPSGSLYKPGAAAHSPLAAASPWLPHCITTGEWSCPLASNSHDKGDQVSASAAARARCVRRAHTLRYNRGGKRQVSGARVALSPALVHIGALRVGSDGPTPPAAPRRGTAPIWRLAYLSGTREAELAARGHREWRGDARGLGVLLEMPPRPVRGRATKLVHPDVSRCVLLCLCSFFLQLGSRCLPYSACP